MKEQTALLPKSAGVYEGSVNVNALNQYEHHILASNETLIVSP